MTVALTAILYVCFGVFAGAFMAKRCFPQRSADISRIAAVWAAATALIFLTPSAAVFVVLMIGVLAYAAPAQPERRFMYYCAVLPAAPAQIGWDVPFPGIEYLINLQYPALVNLAVLLPLAGAGLRGGSAASRNGVAAVALMYVGLCILLDFRGTSLTNGLRLAVEHMIMGGVVILAARHALGRPGAVKEALFGLMLAGIFLACIGMVQFLKGWPIYTHVSDALRQFDMRADTLFNMREGRQRVDATMQPIPFGIYMAVSAAIMLFQQGETARVGWRRLLAALMVIAVYLSGSRGGFLCLAVAIAGYLFFTPRLAALRGLMIGAALMGLVGLQSGLLDALLSADEYGTFSYRIDLIRNSSHSISSHPLFGTPEYRSDPMLELSRQGQGIIDIVNAYLRMALQYGLIGMLLFVAPLIGAIRAMRARRKRCLAQQDESAEREIRVLLGVVIAFGLSIATVSLVDRLGIYYWVLICIAAAAAYPAAVPVAGAAATARRRAHGKGERHG